MHIGAEKRDVAPPVPIDDFGMGVSIPIVTPDPHYCDARSQCVQKDLRRATPTAVVGHLEDRHRRQPLRQTPLCSDPDVAGEEGVGEDDDEGPIIAGFSPLVCKLHHLDASEFGDVDGLIQPVEVLDPQRLDL
jgi:hypothetical protein